MINLSNKTDDEIQKLLVEDSKWSPCNQAARDERAALYKEVDKRNKNGSKIVY